MEAQLVYTSLSFLSIPAGGCAQEFSSMTFSDTEAAKTPGSVWDYAIERNTLQVRF